MTRREAVDPENKARPGKGGRVFTGSGLWKALGVALALLLLTSFWLARRAPGRWEPRLTLPAPAGGTGLAFSPDGGHLVSTNGGAASLWDVTTGTRSATFVAGSGDTLLSVAFSPNGESVAVGGYG